MLAYRLRWMDDHSTCFDRSGCPVHCDDRRQAGGCDCRFHNIDRMHAVDPGRHELSAVMKRRIV